MMKTNRKITTDSNVGLFDTVVLIAKHFPRLRKFPKIFGGV
jgi:hypothetical protein